MSDGDVQAAITARRAELERAFDAGDLDLLDALLTDDVLWSAADRSTWLGREDVLVNIARFFDQFDYELRFGTPRIDTDGTTAIDRTNFESRVRSAAGSSAQVHRGSVVTVWKRVDGWRLFAYLDLGARLFD